MKKVLIAALVAAFVATTASAKWVYEGQWGKRGSGKGEFLYPYGIDVAPNGNVYVSEEGANLRVQYFTATGSFLGKWRSWGTGQFRDPGGLAVARNGNVYVYDGGRIKYFTATGSFLGNWVVDGYQGGLAVSPYGNVYVAISIPRHSDIYYYTGTGSLLGSWPVFGGELWGVAFSPARTVYVTDENRARYYTRTGSFLGSWLTSHYGITIASSSEVYTTGYDRVHYLTATGSFLGSFGSRGSGKGQFKMVKDIAFSPNGARLYVTDNENHRVQYFRWSPPAVAPASLGRVKALFR